MIKEITVFWNNFNPWNILSVTKNLNLHVLHLLLMTFVIHNIRVMLLNFEL